MRKKEAKMLLEMTQSNIMKYIRDAANAEIPKKKPRHVKPKANDDKVRNRLSRYRNELIRDATEGEKYMKAVLKSISIEYAFQHLFFHTTGGCNYIVDFYIPKYNIVIEVDGGYHNTDKQRGKDKVRTRNLKNVHGVHKIIRFENNRVINETQLVINQLSNTLKYL